MYSTFNIKNSKTLRRFPERLNHAGFTLVEITMACLILAFVIMGVWGVYWSVMNTYYVEQRASLIQSEGLNLIDLMENGGYRQGKRIFGLKSQVPREGYPIVGETESINFKSIDENLDVNMPGANPEYRPDYRYEFSLDSEGTPNPRFAEFAVQLYGDDLDGAGGDDPTPYSTAVLWFRLKDTSGDPDNNYQVKLTENLLTRKEMEGFGDPGKTWNKVHLLPEKKGFKFSFYLANMDDPVQYNSHLERDLTASMGDPQQRKIYVGGLPYPEYFSASVSLLSEKK
jgi:hypothetical protein